MNFIDTVQPMTSLIISLITLAGLVIAVFKFSRDPDIKNRENIEAFKIEQKLKNKRLDEVVNDIRESVKTICGDIRFMKENDIKHIEQEIRLISERQNKILTILEYKEKIKID